MITGFRHLAMTIRDCLCSHFLNALSGRSKNTGELRNFFIELDDDTESIAERLSNDSY